MFSRKDVYLLSRFRENVGKGLDNDRILLS